MQWIYGHNAKTDHMHTKKHKSLYFAGVYLLCWLSFQQCLDWWYPLSFGIFSFPLFSFSLLFSLLFFSSLSLSSFSHLSLSSLIANFSMRCWIQGRSEEETFYWRLGTFYVVTGVSCIIVVLTGIKTIIIQATQTLPLRGYFRLMARQLSFAGWYLLAESASLSYRISIYFLLFIVSSYFYLHSYLYSLSYRTSINFITHFIHIFIYIHYMCTLFYTLTISSRCATTIILGNDVLIDISCHSWYSHIYVLWIKERDLEILVLHYSTLHIQELHSIRTGKQPTFNNFNSELMYDISIRGIIHFQQKFGSNT